MQVKRLALSPEASPDIRGGLVPYASSVANAQLARSRRPTVPLCGQRLREGDELRCTAGTLGSAVVSAEHCAYDGPCS